MRVLNLLLLLFLLAGGVSAQDLPAVADAPDVVVVEKKWRSEMRYPLLEQDPLRPNMEQMELERALKQNQRDNSIRASMGLPPLPPPTRVPAMREEKNGSPTVQYIYQARFMNSGTRQIKRVVWEYVFFDPATQKEVGRRSNDSKVEIRPGKTKNVTVRSAVPPTSTINVTQMGKKQPEQYTEQVVIQKIEYSDGTFWHRPSN